MTSETQATFETKARQVGDRSAGFLAHLGLGRLAGGVLLIVIGALVLALPALIQWFVGIGAIVLGVLVIAGGTEPTRGS